MHYKALRNSTGSSLRKSFECTIIGAGASGLMSASVLNDPSVLIIDTNASIGKKLAISGGGRCNITNCYLSPSYYEGDSSFIQTIFTHFDNKKLLGLLDKGGVNYSLDPKIVTGTYFCKSSKDVLNLFQKLTNRCQKLFNTRVECVQKSSSGFTVVCKDRQIETKRLIVASGGLSYSNLGATAIGYEIAKSMGHSVTQNVPALVGLTVQKPEFWFKDLSGVSLLVTIKVGEKILSGDLLFTHKGISGPVVLSTSLYWKKGKITIDFLPKHNLQKLLKSKKMLFNALPLPKRFVKAFCKAVNISDKSANSVTKDEFARLQLLQSYTLSPAGNFGYTKAEVTSGGVATSELTHACKSKLVDGLYFVGEVVDVTGQLGGYNLQWAFSSGYVAAKDLQKYKVE